MLVYDDYLLNLQECCVVVSGSTLADTRSTRKHRRLALV